MTFERFGRYRVTGTLGAGGMGEVFAAVDDVLGREVAVKTLRGNAAGLAARLLDERFRQEARAIASLHHPGVVQVFDIDIAATPPYLVMERVAGPSLKERLAAGPLATDELLALGIQIARAIAAAHAAGVVHRDVKPANILAAGPGRWKLADFGVAHVPDSSLTMSGQFVGSPAYAPPEALLRGDAGAPGDVYGLAATLYEAAAGRWPRVEISMAALLAPLPPLDTLAPSLSAAVALVIDSGVAIEPAQRPTPDAFADALARAASEAVTTAPIATTTAPLPTSAPVSQPIEPAQVVALPPLQRSPARGFALIGGISFLLVVVAVLLLRTDPTPGIERVPERHVVEPEGPHPPPGPGERRDPASIQNDPPPGMDGKQSRDWKKIFEEVDKGHYEGARHKLREFEDRYGELEQTRALRPQLDALGPDVHREDDRGPGRRRGKKRHDD